MQSNGPSSLATRIAKRDLLVLDGATGTELERRGAAIELPLWSARALIEAPELVAAIHRDYVEAGADVITANSFRSQRRTLERGGVGERAEELTRSAVEIARRAAREGAPNREIFVVGSAPPLEDCFRPDLVPADHELAREHAEHAEHLAAAGVDGILIETMNSGREALAALRAARATGLPSLVSFVCWDGTRLLSDESLHSALARIEAARPDAVLVNCLPASNVAACLAILRDTKRPFGLYPNLGTPTDSGGHSEALEPSELAEHVSIWRDTGASLFGGCCGTTPAHTLAIAQRLRN
ncbi:MAG: homocysteine S-methyltransferase family protein [Deltaproteobacteria bacterium]|nr:homocysteine S-methyltransferase family protein [Deltaproteobacteria bacterium]MBW2401753.1 homocysteine S-methyltransferase family protein [Deltaproteobacteria bacterium]